MGGAKLTMDNGGDSGVEVELPGSKEETFIWGAIYIPSHLGMQGDYFIKIGVDCGPDFLPGPSDYLKGLFVPFFPTFLNNETR